MSRIDIKASDKARRMVADAAIRAEKRDSAAPKGRPTRSYADLLDRLYSQFDDLANEIAISDAPSHQKADALSKLARTLPLLQAAETATKTKAKDKDLSALTDAELELLVSKQLGRSKRPSTPDSPFEGSAAGVSTPSRKKVKKPISDVGNFPTPDEDDDGTE